MQIVSKCWDQHAKGKSLLTLNFIVSVVQDPEVLKLLPLTSFYVVHIKIYFSPKCPLQCNSSRAPAMRTVTAARYLGVCRSVVRLRFRVTAPSQNRSLNIVIAGRQHSQISWLRKLERWQCDRCKASETDRLAQPARLGYAANDCITYLKKKKTHSFNSS